MAPHVLLRLRRRVASHEQNDARRRERESQGGVDSESDGEARELWPRRRIGRVRFGTSRSRRTPVEEKPENPGLSHRRRGVTIVATAPLAAPESVAPTVPAPAAAAASVIGLAVFTTVPVA